MLVMLYSVKSELLQHHQWTYCFKTAAKCPCENVIVVLQKKRSEVLYVRISHETRLEIRFKPNNVDVYVCVCGSLNICIYRCCL